MNDRNDFAICPECRRDYRRSRSARPEWPCCDRCAVASPRRRGNGYPDGFECRVVDGVQLVAPYWRKFDPPR